MNFEEFKYHYWNVFIDYISAFYPLKLETIEQYRYDLNWRTLSSNTSIDWKLQFIDDNKNNLIWHLIALNPKIPIDVEFVRKYKNRLDWYYLARNPSLPLTEEFIEENIKDFSVDETHPDLSEHLKINYPDRIIQKQNIPPMPEGIENCTLDNFKENWNKWRHNVYPHIYDRLIEPNINGQSIENILKRVIPQPGKFVYISPEKNDELGLITSFEPEPRDAINSILEENSNQDIEFKQSSLQEGRDRIYSLVGIPAQSHPCLLISESLYQLFEKHNLATYHKVRAKLKPNKLTIKQNYWLLIFEDNTLITECDKEQEFEFFFKRFSETGPKRVITGNSAKFEELKIEASKEYSESISSIIQFYPKSLNIRSNVDLFTLNRKIIISERLRESMIQNGFGPIKFNSTMPMILKSQIENDLIALDKTIETTHSSIEPDNYYHTKKERLIQSDPPFKRFNLFADRISRVERKLNIIFPKQFKREYSKTRILFADGSLIEEFEWLPIKEFFIENGYSERYPESYKSCVVGENGVGDYIGLMLEKNEDYKLSSKYIVFNHETGEVLEGKLQITSDDDDVR